MENVDVHLINWSNDEKNPTRVGDYWSNSYEYPNEDAFLGGSNDLEVQKLSYNSVTGEKTISYLRKLKTNDKSDNEIIIGTNKLFTAWAYKAVDMSKHGSYVQVGSFNINPDYSVDISLGRYLPWEVHGIYLLIVWSIVNSISYFSVRVMKHSPPFMWFHRLYGFFKGFSTIALVIVGLTTSVEPLNDDISYNIHKIGGLVLGGLIVLVFAIGAFQSISVTGKNLESDKILRFRVVHRVLGIMISYVIGLIIITGSFQLYQD